MTAKHGSKNKFIVTWIGGQYSLLAWENAYMLVQYLPLICIMEPCPCMEDSANQGYRFFVVHELTALVTEYVPDIPVSTFPNAQLPVCKLSCQNPL